MACAPDTTVWDTTKTRKNKMRKKNKKTTRQNICPNTLGQSLNFCFHFCANCTRINASIMIITIDKQNLSKGVAVVVKSEMYYINWHLAPCSASYEEDSAKTGRQVR